MKKLKEKSFTVNVNLNEKYPDIVQTMLEHLYNEGSLHYDEVRLSDREVVSEKYYKGLTYGNISEDALAKKAAIEKDGYNFECIFTVAEKLQDPFIDCFGHRQGDYCIRAEVRYALKLKFSFTKLEDLPDEGRGSVPVNHESKEKAEQFILGNADRKTHRRKRALAKVSVPF